jgi:hypothetical protein
MSPLPVHVVGLCWRGCAQPVRLGRGGGGARPLVREAMAGSYSQAGCTYLGGSAPIIYARY